MTKVVYPKARIALYLSLASILVMILNLYSFFEWMMIAGIFLSFSLAIWAIVSAIISLRFIYHQQVQYRGDSMCWIAISLGVIAMLSNLPFVITILSAYK